VLLDRGGGRRLDAQAPGLCLAARNSKDDRGEAQPPEHAGGVVPAPHPLNGCRCALLAQEVAAPPLGAPPGL